MKAIPIPIEEPATILDEERIGACVTVNCTGRLHLGFFDLEGGPGRRFGSIGLSLDRPVTRLRKRAGGSGEVHVAASIRRTGVRHGRYYQRRVAGEPISAAFLAAWGRVRRAWAEPAMGRPVCASPISLWRRIPSGTGSG